MNSKKRGGVGVAKAIAYYAEQGHAVFTPIADISRYDLLVDMNGQIKRIEVKTTSAQSGRIELRTLGGNQSWSGVAKFISSEDCDEVFCCNLNTGAIAVYPSREIQGRTMITLR